MRGSGVRGTQNFPFTPPPRILYMVNQKIKIRFAKKGLMRFLSHLDLMRLFHRAARRARLPLSITEGFNPHLRISIQPAIKLGRESDSLEAIFGLHGWMKPEGFKEMLQEQLPDGIEIIEATIC